MKARSFVDHVSVYARAGKGGDGSASFRRESRVPEGGPDGGDGGRGGHVLFRGSRNVSSLVSLYFAPRLIAGDGVDGRGQKMYGRAGRDAIALVPCGTEIYDAETGRLLADIVADGQEVLLARGGRGGLGNVHFKTPTHQAPTECTPGKPGQEFRLRLELKTIADAGLLGFPNAGKSSLLACVSAARPKIASYPFTTLNPVIGTAEYPDFSQIRIADVPGIIEGAADGVGLGVDFLKHLERSRMLVYVIDMAGTDNRLPWKDFQTLRTEIGRHDPDLLDRPCLVVANKMDRPAARDNLPRFIRETGENPIETSALDPAGAGCALFKKRLHELLRPLPRGAWRTPAPENAPPPPAHDPDAASLHEDSLRAAPFLDLGAKPRKRR